MEFTDTMKKNYEFRRLYAKGDSAAAPYLVLYARKSASGTTNRLGITVSTKVGKAVVRNRVRRRIREIYRLHEYEVRRGVQLVIVARSRAAFADYRQLERSFMRACERLSLLREGENE